MRTVVSLPASLVVVTSLLVGALLAVGARLGLRRLIDEDDRSAVAGVVGPLMPALGAVFALLAALSLSNEATELRSADHDIAFEAGAAARLAWSATTPGVDADAVQRSLLSYLRSSRAEEWTGASGAGDPATQRALGDLERTVRAAAAASELGSAQAGELLGSLDSVTSMRRERLATRAHEMPLLYLVVVLAAGAALVVNSAALGLDRGQRVALLTAGLVVVVSLVVAILLSITAPFSGGFTVDAGPIDAVTADLDAGVFVG